ncbi:MAG: phosphoenolpyruvate--protein phosphotransferase [Oscillospiraceae bacterium]|nr:phosphoenolpyruvate--protein phosphotransferase [Oscillospiraceae bacterium]
MITLKGKSVQSGVVFGRIHFHCPDENNPGGEGVPAGDEFGRFKAAQTEALRQLEVLAEQTRAGIGQAEAELFDVHKLMLGDGDYLDIVTAGIAQGQPAEQAVAAAGKQMAGFLSGIQGGYIAERAADVLDVSGRVINILRGHAPREIKTDGPVILAGEQISPSQMVGLDKTRILAIATAEGSRYSHMAILAQAMNIPATVGLGDALTLDSDGKDAILDGEAGVIYIQPDQETAARMRQKLAGEQAQNAALALLDNSPDSTIDGKEVLVYANVASAEQAKEAAVNGCKGIGLYRSEFLFLGREGLPDEDEQYETYREILQAADGREVVLRTLDIGADKSCKYLNLEKESNPELGLRGIRLAFVWPELLITQLRAIYRASVFGRAAVLFPMIASVWEVDKLLALAASVRETLAGEGIDFDPNIPIGGMIETPAAALISDQLAKRLNFFSIGTNDLTQYTLAADRQNPALGDYYNQAHPAVLALIQMAAQNAKAADIPACVCGALAGDLAQTQTLLELGVDRLSVSPVQIPRLRAKIRALRLQED